MDTKMQFTGYDFERATIEEFSTPTNKREVPCDGCKFEDMCAEKFTDCKAMRTWLYKGDYEDADVAKKINIIRN
jgi:hypothetical protein